MFIPDKDKDCIPEDGQKVLLILNRSKKNHFCPIFYFKCSLIFIYIFIINYLKLNLKYIITKDVGKRKDHLQKKNRKNILRRLAFSYRLCYSVLKALNTHRIPSRRKGKLHFGSSEPFLDLL